jgi:hypothetical protein
MPASIIASTRKKKYAGPLPDSAGDGVLLRLGHPDHLADGAEQVLDRLAGARAGVRAGRDRRHRLVHEDRGVGHDATTRCPPGAAPPRAGRDAGRHRHDQRARPHVRGDLEQQRAHVLRLHGQQDDVRLRGGLLRARGGDAVPLGDLGRVVGVPLGGEHAAGRRAGAQQPGQQRLAQLADAEQRDGRAHDRLASARRKKTRLAGRSASRRMR